METRRLCIVLALLLLFISMEVGSILAQGNGNDNGNGNGGGSNGNENGNGNAGGNNGNANGNGNAGGNNGNDNGNGNAGGNNGNANGNGNAGGNNGNGNGNGNAGGNNGNGNGNGNSGGNNGNGNGNGNVGGNNGNGNGNGNGGGNNGNGNGNGNAGGNNGNGNGNGNTGGNNGNGNGSGNAGGNNGNGNGNGNTGGNNGNGNGNGNGGGATASSGQPRKRPPYDAASTNYDVLTPLPNSNRESVFCKARGSCHYKILTCPAECPERKPKKNKKHKGCFFDCSSVCQVSCKWRRPKCNGYGALCYDPRFVGGDGVMFYFHGSKGSNFAIVSDDNFQINAHLIGTRPQGRSRDYTWVQALSVMFDTHTLVVAAKKVSRWNDGVDALVVKWDGESVEVPTDGEAEWRTGEVVVERTDDVNTVRVTVSGLVEMDIRVTPIGAEENRVHNYQLSGDDAFAHLETQFRFVNLSDNVEGILGKTYRPGYVSPAKRGVPMPVVGGEDKYWTPSLYSPSCKVCVFSRPSKPLDVA